MTKTAPSRRLQPGDLICGVCGEGNPSTRRFCSRCGSSLVEAVRVKESWWRRLLRKLTPRRGPKVVKISASAAVQKDGTPSTTHYKPGIDLKQAMRRILRTARRILSVLILIGGLIYGVYPPFRHTANNWVVSVKNRISNDFNTSLSPIHAVSVTANVTSPGSFPIYAADEGLNTYWLAPWSSSAEPVLTFKFSKHVTLKRMILHSGAGSAFAQHGRPASLRLTFSNGEMMTLIPQDTSTSQTLNIDHADLITSMQIKVTGIDAGSAEPSDVAITEIELFGLST